jgi:hypothetical protein
MAKNPTANISGFPTEPPLIADANTQNGSLDDLGWADADSEAFAEQRAYLANHNGIRGLERLQPEDVEDAVRLFYRDGFVVIENVLTPETTRPTEHGVRAGHTRCSGQGQKPPR